MYVSMPLYYQPIQVEQPHGIQLCVALRCRDLSYIASPCIDMIRHALRVSRCLCLHCTVLLFTRAPAGVLVMSANRVGSGQGVREHADAISNRRLGDSDRHVAQPDRDG